jgi:hypothetical protein
MRGENVWATQSESRLAELYGKLGPDLKMGVVRRLERRFEIQWVKCTARGFRNLTA